MNKSLEIAEESEDNVLSNQQREEGNKEKTEGIADGINQCSHLRDTTVYAWNVIDNDFLFIIHWIKNGWLGKWTQ